jgi:tRNA (adenine37-N6)-methyltransferase
MMHVASGGDRLVNGERRLRGCVPLGLIALTHEELTYRPIGVIHTPFARGEDAPIQGVFSGGATGEVEVFEEFEPGLKDLEGFSHIILLYHFHLADGAALVKKPFLDTEERGIFSIRHFNRPNPIGLTVVELEGIEGNVLKVRGVDMVDGTPLLDIKPYVCDFDVRRDTREGWYETASEKDSYRQPDSE